MNNVTAADYSRIVIVPFVSAVLFLIHSRALGPGDVRMVVLDISLPTGFTPENSDLEMLSNSVHRYISNFQIVDNLSDRGSLIIHLFKCP
ncbi:complement C3 alpha chain-like [Amphiprion ocellaris]|uniref:complement C3 alpha chain-like n=1 Tax=Amphiprion ocellaris TaxID=80972 RepID=UPI0024119595|nr:complement C3 alpha chain-like [Amphiprion ocellaris]